MYLTKVLAYKTRRYHYLITENQADVLKVCENRFGYILFINGFEPEWAIIFQRELNHAESNQMIHGNLCPRCNEWHKQPLYCGSN